MKQKEMVELSNAELDLIGGGELCACYCLEYHVGEHYVGQENGGGDCIEHCNSLEWVFTGCTYARADL